MRDLLLCSGALLGLALSVNVGSSAFSGWLPPIAVAAVEAAVLVMLAAPLLAWAMHRAGRGALPAHDASEHLAVERRNAELEMMAMAAQRTSSAVVFTDADRKITWVNSSFTRITEYTLADVIGRAPGALLQCERTDPTTIAAIRAALNDGIPGVSSSTAQSPAGSTGWISISSRCVTWMAC